MFRELLDYQVFLYPPLDVVFNLRFRVDGNVLRIKCLRMSNVKFFYLVFINDLFCFKQTLEVCRIVHKES